MNDPSRSGQAPETIAYDDQIVRWFLWATLIWGVVGMLVGVVIAVQLPYWEANLGTAWLTFGRLRPLHTNAVIFAFTCNAIFAGMYYCTQRLLKSRMFSDLMSRLHFWAWQAIIVAAAITLPLGLSQGKEYAELIWPIDLAVAVVWVMMAVNFFATIAIRRVNHLYVSLWFIGGSILTIAMLHVVNSLAIPTSLTHSYPVYAGVQDALVQWWYGHNAVGFLLTTPILGLMYYFLPKAAEQPVYSYRLSIVHFWSLFFIYIWAGPHHLLYTSLPEWAQSVGMVFSVMLIAPSWGGMLNGLLTLRGAWGRVRTDPVLKFFVMAITFYGMSTLEGPLMSIKSVNYFTHYNDYTVGHVHSGALGWVGGMIFGMAYWLVPRLYKRPLFSTRMAEAHFWLATIGLVLYVVSMWTAGIQQALMWFATNADGSLKYPQFLETVVAIKSLYWIRALGGSLYLGGALLAVYNVAMTARGVTGLSDETVTVVSERRRLGVASGFHDWLEQRSLPFSVLVMLAVLVGGVVEFMPTFLIESNVPTITSVKPYSPLELEGRDLYVREGCYNCHSQMIRSIVTEVQRFGEVAHAGEFVYDHPFQWGSKRSGPDLLRVGGKYPDVWHYQHMIDPRATSPGSIMPHYAFLEQQTVSVEDVPSKLKAMQRLGVPYADDLVASPDAAMRAQDAAIRGRLAESGVKIGEMTELVALIAYLQRLGTDIKGATPEELKAAN